MRFQPLWTKLRETCAKMDIQPLLVVEDETLIRLDLVDMLEADGFEVDGVADGTTGMNEIDRRNGLRGLITDIKLGSGIDGWEVARHARQRFPDIAVVYITGDSAGDWPDKGVSNSIIIQKPFQDAQVLTAITKLLNPS